MKIKQNCDICKTYTYLDSHHIISKSKGGTNKKSNKTNICPNCHRKVHLGEIIIEGKFLTSDGIQILWHNVNEQSITEKEPDVYIFGRPD